MVTGTTGAERSALTPDAGAHYCWAVTTESGPSVIGQHTSPPPGVDRTTAKVITRALRTELTEAASTGAH